MPNDPRRSALTDEQLADYDRDGFLVLPGRLDAAEVAELCLAADETLAGCGPLLPDNPRVQIDRIDGVVGVRQAYPVIDISERLARFAQDERIVGLFRSLFGGETPVLFEDKLNY